MQKSITPSTTPTLKYTSPSRTVSREWDSERSGPSSCGTNPAQQPTPPPPPPQPTRPEIAIRNLQEKQNRIENLKNAKSRELIWQVDTDICSHLPDEQKQASAKFIYDFMVAKDMKSQDGYLIKDVLAEVQQEISEGTSELSEAISQGANLKQLVSSPRRQLVSSQARSGRLAEQNFLAIVRFAPQYFTIFRASIQMHNTFRDVGKCYLHNARKSERMIRLTVPGPTL
jgi:hypothetical protein